MEKKYEVPGGEEDLVEKSLIELGKEHGVTAGLTRGEHGGSAIIRFYGRTSSIEAAVRWLDSELQEPLKELEDVIY